MEVLLLTLGVLLCVSSVTVADVSRCPSNLSRSATTRLLTYGDQCFQFVRHEKYWDNARDYCWRYGGKLAMINDAGTNAFLVRSLNSLPWTNKGVWIGLHDSSSELTWHWVTEIRGGARTMSWSNWGRGHPRAFLHHHRDCVRMVRGGGTWRWHETPCSFLGWHYRFICQYEMTPATTQHPKPYIVEGYQPNLGGAAPPEGDDHVREMTSSTTVKVTSTTMRPTTIKPKATPKASLTSRENSMTKYEDYDDDLSGVLAPLHLKQEEDHKHKPWTGGLVACGVALIVAVVILIIVLIRRNRRQKFLEEMEDPTFCAQNPTYSSANNNVYTGCGQYGADGQLMLDDCGAQVMFAKAQNDYGVNLAGTKPNNQALATTVLAISGNHYEEADYACLKGDEATAAAGTPAEDNDANKRLEETKKKTAQAAAIPRSKQTLPKTPDDGYEVPSKATNAYLPMNGSGKKPKSASPEPYMNPQMKSSAGATGGPHGYDNPLRENVYAEIPEEAANIYQDLDEVQNEIEHLKESQA